MDFIDYNSAKMLRNKLILLFAQSLVRLDIKLFSY